jgi:hypothetical protein
MPSAVTHWIGLLKADDEAGAQPLWEAYFGRLVDLARAAPLRPGGGALPRPPRGVPLRDPRRRGGWLGHLEPGTCWDTTAYPFEWG